MTSSSPGASPLGLAQAQRRADADASLRITAHNGAAIVGGAERALITLLDGLQRRGHQVALACNHDIVADAAVQQLVPAIVLPLRGDLVLSDAFAFAKFLRRDLPDAFIVGTFKKVWLAGMAAKRAGVPHTVARVGLASDTPRRFKYRIAVRKWIDTIVLNAEEMRPAFERGVPGYDPDRIVTIHTGVKRPAARSDPAAVRKSLGIPADAPVIGSVARLARQKRLERLVAVTAQLPSNVHCIIAGDGSERAALERAVRSHDLSGRVHLLGHRDDVGDVLAALDLFVLTSDQEGMSNAMLEAMAAGVPVVSTPVSGAHEALEAEPNRVAPGVIADGFEPDDIARAVSRLLNDRTRVQQMRAAALERVRTRFDYQRMLDDWEVLLREGPAALGARRP